MCAPCMSLSILQSYTTCCQAYIYKSRNGTTHRHGCDGALGEEPLVLLELSVALVAPGPAAVSLALVGAVLVGGEVPVPAPDYVAVEVRVLEITALEGVDLKGGRGFRILSIQDKDSMVRRFYAPVVDFTRLPKISNDLRHFLVVWTCLKIK